MGKRVRFDWCAAAAIARIAEAAYRPACGAQRRQSHAYLDDSGAHYGSAKRAVFGKDSHLQKRGNGICDGCADFFRPEFWRGVDFAGSYFRRDQRCCKSERMWNAGGRCGATREFRDVEEIFLEEAPCEFYRYSFSSNRTGKHYGLRYLCNRSVERG